MKKTLTILISFCLMIKIYGQDVKTGTGQSSILLETTNVGFDIGESSLSFTTNNFPQSILKSKGSIWGFSAKGKSDEGLTGIFSSSKIVPSSEMSAIYGYSFSNSKEISDLYNSNQKVLKDSIELLSALLKDSLETKLIDQLKQMKDNKAKEYIQNKVNPILQSDLLRYQKLEMTLKEISENRLLDLNITAEANNLYLVIKKNKIWNAFERLNKKISDGINNLITEDYWKFSIYGHLGLHSTKFNIYKGWDSVNIDNSFAKETFRGSNGGFGLNLNLKSRWLFGFRFTYEETNNLNALASTEYKVTKNYTSTSATGSSQIAMTAYPNKYTRAYLNRYDFDIIRFFALEKNSIMITDLYFRIKESTNQSKMVSQKDVGVSASFFKEKGNFIGGIYLELPDIEQNIERKKPENEQKLEDWYKRISFGVYAKFSFPSIINQF